MTDIDCLHARILKEKQLLNGAKVCLLDMPGNGTLWALVRLDKNGRIRDSKCFIWGDMTKRAVQAKANLEYRQWVTSLIQRNFYDEEELDMDEPVLG